MYFNVYCLSFSLYHNMQSRILIEELGVILVGGGGGCHYRGFESNIETDTKLTMHNKSITFT